MADTDGHPDGQRRNNFRVDLRTLARVKVSSFPVVMAQMLDLSGTGCRLKGRFPRVRVGDVGEVVAQIDDLQLDVDFVVRFVEEYPGGSTIGVEFESMTPQEQQRLMRAVFAEHRMQLQIRRQ